MLQLSLTFIQPRSPPDNRFLDDYFVKFSSSSNSSSSSSSTIQRESNQSRSSPPHSPRADAIDGGASVGTSRDTSVGTSRATSVGTSGTDVLSKSALHGPSQVDGSSGCIKARGEMSNGEDGKADLEEGEGEGEGDSSAAWLHHVKPRSPSFNR